MKTYHLFHKNRQFAFNGQGQMTLLLPAQPVPHGYMAVSHDTAEGPFPESLQKRVMELADVPHMGHIEFREPAMVWLVLNTSGIHFGNCVLGVGATKQAAIDDCGGKLPRGAWVDQYVAIDAMHEFPDFETEISTCSQS